MTIEIPNGQNIHGKMVDGTDRKITRDSTNPTMWTLDEGQLASGEDVELFAQIEVQKSKAGEFISAFEYYPESKEAIFGVNVAPYDQQDIDPG